MAPISAKRVQKMFEQGLNATTRTEQGRSLEELICYLFHKIPGIEISRRNKLNTFATEEVDVAFFNRQLQSGLDFLPQIILVECKNWSAPIGSQEVSYFIQCLQNRGRDHGILVAANGITGSVSDITAAHFHISTALSRGINVIVLTRAELEALQDTQKLVSLLKKKLLDLVVTGTTIP